MRRPSRWAIAAGALILSFAGLPMSAPAAAAECTALPNPLPAPASLPVVNAPVTATP